MIRRHDIRHNRDTLYVFGDNVKGYGLKGQAAEARYEPNAFGIATKWKPSLSPDSFFSDNDVCFTEVKADLTALELRLRNYKKLIVFPNIGCGLAKLPEKAPKLYTYLCNELIRIQREKDTENENTR